ncbi:MAG TPA: sensor domain-containing diguanylate cyclase [Burkholderiaceae bacterium]|nr:sensor domain-containing diguanylate cyclase [Burkholderiaceae bacterium]
MRPPTEAPRTLTDDEGTPEWLQVDRMFISTLPAGRTERRWAFLLVLASVAIFLILLPRASRPWQPLQSFIPVYEAGLVFVQLITGLLVFSQWIGLRSKSLFILTCGYFFAAFMGVSYAATFFEPLVFPGWSGTSAQSAAWLYMFRNGGFPFFVVGYALLRGAEVPMSRPRHPLGGVAACMAAMLGAAIGFSLLAVFGGRVLPNLMLGSRYAPAMLGVVSCAWLGSLVALLALWRRRPNSVLDVWLMVAMCASIFDIALSAVFNSGSYDLGFYAGRIYGLLAAGLVLVALLVENAAMHARLVKVSTDLVRLSSTDQLTKIANRRVFEAAIFREWRRAMRQETPLSLVMIDVDHFKRYNDEYGHVAGDGCLKAVARVLTKTTRRATDLVARYGGEEFAVLLPNTTVPEAHRLAQQMCDAVGRLNIPHARSPMGHVTISAGVACVRVARESELRLVTTHGDKEFTMDALTTPVTIVQAADQALYTAKQQGRSRVWDFSLDVPAPYDWGHEPAAGSKKGNKAG